MILRASAVAALMCLAPTTAFAEASPADGAKTYQRCAACHLPNGQGVPGAFPALAGRMSKAAATGPGRDYLVMSVIAGLAGEIEVDGKKMRGVMPAQAGLSDAEVAAALNHAMALPAAGTAATSARSFSAAEVAAIKARFGEATPNSIHAIRSGAFPPAAEAK